MKNLILTTLLALFVVSTIRAQSEVPTNGYKIVGQLKGVKDTTCVLAHYFGSTQYIPKDTARVDKDGRMVFEGKQNLPQGLYLLVAPQNRYLQFLITDDQDFSFEADTANVIASMRITGSKENELFYTYQQKLNKLFSDVQSLRAQKNEAAIKALQTEANTYRTQFMKDNAGTFTVKLFKASAEPEVPPAPKTASGKSDSTWVFNYFKSHFWDDFDFSDERFVRTPFLQQKIDRYIKELTVQQSDSLIKSADYVVNKAIAGKNKEIKYYTIYYITSPYEKPTVMGTDGLFVHMFEKYYATGIMSVSDSSTLKNIGERVASMKPNLVGKTFVAPVVTDTLRKPIILQNIKADYTVVFFYSPTCGHCRESAPKLQKFADDYKGKGIDVLAISIDQDQQEWKKFIKEFKLGNALNGMDVPGRTNYAKQYDVWTTPTIYVLDKDKRIIARKLPVEQLEDFVLFYKKQHPAQNPPTNAKASVKK